MLVVSLMLTKNQSRFAHRLITSASKTSAYKNIYAPSKMSSKTINEAASRLSKNPKVVARLDELKSEKEAEKRVLRLSYADFVINELTSIALKSKSGMARIKSLELLGKTVGLFNCD